MRITFTVENGIEDGQAGHSGDIADGVVDLHVHLIERFLNPEEMLAAGLHEAIAVAHQRAHSADRRRWAKRRVEQSNRVKILQPLAVQYVGLTTGDVLGMAGVYQAYLQSAVLEDLIQRHPVDPSRFHRDCLDPTGDQPASLCKSAVCVPNDCTG